MGFRSGEIAGQSSTPTPWSFKQLLVLLAVWAGAKSCWKISIFKKLVSRRKQEVLQNFLVNGCSDIGFQKTQWTNTSRWHCTPNHQDWGNNTGLQATCAMSFSTLPPDTRDLGFQMKYKTFSHLKRGLWTTGNSPVLLLSPGKTPLTTTVAKFLDTSVCGGSWCLDPSLSPFLVKFTQILESICLTILIRLRFSQLVVHLFLPHFFLPLNFLLTCLDTALCEQLLWQWMFVAYPPCEGCQWLSSGQLSDQQSSPWLCSLVNQTERPFWRLRKALQVFWVD